MRQQHLFHLLIDRHISAPEAIDRLFRVADDKELAGER